MKQRCYNQNDPKYGSYGGKGIAICKEWLDDFMNFYDWAMENGYTDELTIDRIDPKKGYSPDNCRWITMEENNMRGIVKEKNDITRIRELTGLSQVKFCEKYHIPLNTFARWEQGKREPPDYLVELLEFRVKNDTEKILMKKKEDILKDLYSTLAELQGTEWSEENENLEKYLKIKLSVLYDILGEEVPEEYWEQIEEWSF